MRNYLYSAIRQIILSGIICIRLSGKFYYPCIHIIFTTCRATTVTSKFHIKGKNNTYPSTVKPKAIQIGYPCHYNRILLRSKNNLSAKRFFNVEHRPFPIQELHLYPIPMIVVDAGIFYGDMTNVSFNNKPVSCKQN